MNNGRYLRNTNPQADYADRGEADFTRDFGSGQDYTYSSAREYQAAGEYDRGRGRDDGPRDDGNSGYAQRDRRPYGQGRDQGLRRYGRDAGFQGSYRGGDGSDGRRFTDASHRGYGRGTYGQRGDRERPEGYDYDERDFFSRAGDEVRSWFGDEEAGRRRELDSRYDERQGRRWSSPRDDDYHSWRRSQIDALDRDYEEYRRENRSKFDNEFGSWRAERQTQRSALSKVSEHMEVVGSDGGHVGTVDKVRGDRIVLTRSDTDAGGRHHSIPSRWIRSVDDKVTIGKTAEEAKAHWRDEERNGAFFGDERGDGGATDARLSGRSFSGTY